MGSSARARWALVFGFGTGYLLAIVVSCGILGQRILGATPATALTANVATTIAALAAVLLTVRTYVTSLDPVGRDVHLLDRRVLELLGAQAVGAIFGIVTIHAFVRESVASHPWLREDPRQLVNDLVAVFGILAFVWACAQKPIRAGLMVAALGLVVGYEITGGYWHFDAPPPYDVAWSVQRFVGGEVTASGIGVLVFRLTLA